MSLRYFNQTVWTAIFSGTDTEIGRMVRVEGWDQANGTALVVDLKDRWQGRLPARDDDHHHSPGSGGHYGFSCQAVSGPLPGQAPPGNSDGQVPTPPPSDGKHKKG